MLVTFNDEYPLIDGLLFPRIPEDINLLKMPSGHFPLCIAMKQISPCIPSYDDNGYPKHSPFNQVGKYCLKIVDPSKIVG
jgi:hypothetical protein